MQRPFKVLGIQQVALGCLDKTRMKKLWVDMLGLAQIGTFRSEHENVDEDILALGQGVQVVEVDIMQPLDPNKKPRVHIPALNHIGLWIDDLPRAVAWLTARGVRFARGASGVAPLGTTSAFFTPSTMMSFRWRAKAC